MSSYDDAKARYDAALSRKKDARVRRDVAKAKRDDADKKREECETMKTQIDDVILEALDKAKSEAFWALTKLIWSYTGDYATDIKDRLSTEHDNIDELCSETRTIKGDINDQIKEFKKIVRTQQGEYDVAQRDMDVAQEDMNEAYAEMQNAQI